MVNWFLKDIYGIKCAIINELIVFKELPLDSELKGLINENGLDYRPITIGFYLVERSEEGTDEKKLRWMIDIMPDGNGENIPVEWVDDIGTLINHDKEINSYEFVSDKLPFNISEETFRSDVINKVGDIASKITKLNRMKSDSRLLRCLSELEDIKLRLQSYYGI